MPGRSRSVRCLVCEGEHVALDHGGGCRASQRPDLFEIFPVLGAEIRECEEFVAEEQVGRSLADRQEHECLHSFWRMHSGTGCQEEAEPTDNIGAERRHCSWRVERGLEAGQVRVVDRSQQGLCDRGRPAESQQIGEFGEREQVGPTAKGREQLHPEVEEVHAVEVVVFTQPSQALLGG